MAISDRITSIEEHIKESYQELEGIGIDTTEVDKNLENIPKLIDGYWETLPKVTGEGTSITLDNTKEGKMKINLKGNTSQATSILPSEYTQVDYIQSSNTQYIDTGYLAKGSLKVITDIEYTSTVSGNQFIYGGRDSSEVNTNAVLFSRNDTKFRNDYNTKVVLASPTISNLVAKWHIVKDKGSLTMTSSDNQTITQTTTNATFSSSYNVYIFTCNNASNVLNSASYRLYTFKMYDNDTLVRDYVPCYRNSDNEIGLYDLVNNVFYTNAGTGAFTKGNNTTLPNPDYPQDIHIVSGENTIIVSNSDNTQSQSYPISLGDIELCKIGDYQDSIVKDNGKWYLNKQIGKVVLNGSENWTNSSTGSVNRFYTGAYSTKIAGLPTTTSAYCNYYRYGGAISNPTQRGTFVYNVSSGTTVANGNLTLVTTNYYTTTTQLKSALETNNAIIYHQLVTPTTTEIIDSTLITQLEALNGSKSYTTQTNINQVNNDNASVLNASALSE